MIGKQEMGARLRAERRARNLTLQALSRASGIAISTLSKAELGQIALSYEKFAAVARALGIDMGSLFQPSGATPPPVRPTVVKHVPEEVEDYASGTYRHAFLFPAFDGKRMTPVEAVIMARSEQDFDDYVRHAGQEFVIVLSGQVRIQFEDGSSVMLRRNESAYFDSGVGHMYLSVGRTPARVIAVCSDLQDDAPAM
jgi:transcriptional regulator with XRE-family HTH domain